MMQNEKIVEIKIKIQQTPFYPKTTLSEQIFPNFFFWRKNRSPYPAKINISKKCPYVHKNIQWSLP